MAAVGEYCNERLMSVLVECRTLGILWNRAGRGQERQQCWHWRINDPALAPGTGVTSSKSVFLEILQLCQQPPSQHTNLRPALRWKKRTLITNIHINLTAQYQPLWIPTTLKLFCHCHFFQLLTTTTFFETSAERFFQNTRDYKGFKNQRRLTKLTYKSLKSLWVLKSRYCCVYPNHRYH